MTGGSVSHYDMPCAVPAPGGNCRFQVGPRNMFSFLILFCVIDSTHLLNSQPRLLKSRGVVIIIINNPLTPLQHPILNPSTPTRKIAQSLDLQHVTGIIIRPSTRQIRTIESDVADWLAEAQDRDIRKRIRVFV